MDNAGLVNQAADIVVDGAATVNKNLAKLHLTKAADELEPMDVEEIEICKELIAEFYPLRQTKTYELLPWLCCCVRSCGRTGALGRLRTFSRSLSFQKLAEEEEAASDW